MNILIRMFNKTKHSKFHKSAVNFYSTFMSTVKSILNIKNVMNIRSYGMSEHKSSSTLQNSVSSWTFGKSKRFSSYNKSEVDNIYNLPDKKNLRFTSQGFGLRNDLRPKVGQHSPPPDTYRIASCFETNALKKKGPLILEKIEPLVWLC